MGGISRNGFFLLHSIDRRIGINVLCTRFFVDDVDLVRRICDVSETDADAEMNLTYSIEPEEVDLLAKSFGFSVPEGNFDFELTAWRLPEGTRPPYLVHTGIELFLMLDGRKPFAQFSGSFHDEYLVSQIDRFAPFVKDGRLISRIVDRPFADNNCDGIREAYFALPGQEWRIEAFLLLSKVSSQSGWNESLERCEGVLLGYEDWQNEWWIKNLRQHRAGYGMATVYMAISASELRWVRAAGRRALSWDTNEPDLRLVLYPRRPELDVLRLWMRYDASDAVVRFGVKHEFLATKTRQTKNKLFIYELSRHDAPELNNHIVSQIEVIAEA